MSSQTYQRILLKYSGEAVAGDEDQGIDPKVLHFMSKEIKSIVDKGVCVGLVIGGGNLFRGEKLNQDGMDRVAGDHMGDVGNSYEWHCFKRRLRERWNKN